MEPLALNGYPLRPEHVAPLRNELLVLRHDVLDGVAAGVARLLRTRVLQTVEKLEADALAVDVAVREGPAKLVVGREAVRVPLPGQADREGLEGALGVDLVGQVGEDLPVAAGLLTADGAAKDVALDEFDGRGE